MARNNSEKVAPHIPMRHRVMAYARLCAYAEGMTTQRLDAYEALCPATQEWLDSNRAENLRRIKERYGEIDAT